MHLQVSDPGILLQIHLQFPVLYRHICQLISLICWRFSFVTILSSSRMFKNSQFRNRTDHNWNCSSVTGNLPAYIVVNELSP